MNFTLHEWFKGRQDQTDPFGVRWVAVSVGCCSVCTLKARPRLRTTAAVKIKTNTADEKRVDENIWICEVESPTSALLGIQFCLRLDYPFQANSSFHCYLGSQEWIHLLRLPRRILFLGLSLKLRMPRGSLGSSSFQEHNAGFLSRTNELFSVTGSHSHGVH